MILLCSFRPSQPVERSSEDLRAFRFRWQYRPGRVNVADSSSRVQAVKLAAAAVNRGQKHAAEQRLAASPAANFSPALPSDPRSVLSQTPNAALWQLNSKSCQTFICICTRAMSKTVAGMISCLSVIRAHAHRDLVCGGAKTLWTRSNCHTHKHVPSGPQKAVLARVQLQERLAVVLKAQ